MATRIFLVLALASCWTSLLVGQSPPPPPTPAETANEEQQQSANEKDTSNKTQQPTIGPTRDNESAQQESDNSGAKSSTDRWIIFFTGLLTLLSALQYWAMRQQAGYMRDGLAETKRAADAAKISADASTQALEDTRDALRKTERAVVLLEDTEATHWSEPGWLDRHTVVFFRLKNYGRTAAYNVALTGRLEFQTNYDEMPQQASVTLASGGVNLWNARSLGLWLDNISLDFINQGQARFQYVVKVIYWDVFSTQHSHEATGRWNAALKRFDFGGDRST